MGPSAARQEWPSLLVALLAILLAGWPAWSAPTRLAVGGDWTEAPGHLWGLWTTAEGLWTHGPLWRSEPGLSWPEGFSGHLIDPASLLLFLPGFLLAGGGPAGAVLGWNLVHVGLMAIGCAGTWALARKVVPEPGPGGAGARAMAVATLGFAPFWTAQPWLGRSEYLVLLLLPAQVLATWTGVERGRPGALVGATLLLGLVGLNTGYGGLFAALLLLPLGLTLLAIAPDRRRAALRLGLVAAGALLLALPGLLALLADPSVARKLEGQGQLPPGLGPCLLLRACTAPDLDRKMDAPLVLGLVPLALGLLGLLRAPRRAGPWLLLAAWLLVWGLGLLRPLLMSVPMVSAVKEWARLGSLLPLALGLAAAVGLVGITRTLPPRLALLPTLLALGLHLADSLSFPRETWPARRPAFPVAPPSALLGALDALPAGPVITLPFERSLQPDRPPRPAFHALWQRVHGRGVSSALDGRVDVLLGDSGFVQALALVEAQELRPSPGAPLSPDCLRADARRLATLGWVGLVQSGPEASPAQRQLLDEVLGQPIFDEPEARAWTLPASGPARPCRVPQQGRSPPLPRRSGPR